MIVIVDYGLGNLASVLNMFKKAGIENVCVSCDEKVIANASKLVLPGVGSFDAGMKNLEDSKLIPLLYKKVFEDETPILGICLGMQLLTKRSEEGEKSGLGWIDAETVKFNLNSSLKLKVPHMGWNYITVQKQNSLIDSICKSRFYFVHSYYVKCFDQSQSLATSHFGNDFTCMVMKDNIYGVQFHPEKSLKFGMKLLENFSKI